MKKILISLLAVILTTGLFAAQRTVEEAAAIAKQVHSLSLRKVIKKSATGQAPERQTSTVRLVRTQLQPKSSKPAFYVFNRDQQGFVIVSADDNTRDVLAYSDEGTFSDQVPDNVQFLLDYMAERIAYSGKMGKTAAATTSYTPVTPLLDGIQWDQDEPYWNMCPIDKNGDRAYTGCVATATAQVMRYWKWPTKGTGSHSYTAENVSGTLSANFGATTYDWANMPKTTSGYTTTAQKNAVATLMYHVGVAIDMNYGGETIGGSAAYTNDVATALVDYFGYKNTLEYVNTCDWDYTHEEWVISEPAATTAQRMRDDLAKGHPIVVGGSSESASFGHEFVFEGYDKNGLFYVNWGWGGSYNGYYAIDDLEPGGSGIGGNGAGYSHYLDYIIGIEPNGSVTPPTPSTPQTISGLQNGNAYYRANNGSPLWDIDSYKGYNNNPRLYVILNAKSKTSLSGTYSLLYVEYTTTTGKTIEAQNGNVTISLAQDGKYRMEGIFYGNDGNAYAFDQTITISAYDYDNDYAAITLVEPTWGEWKDFAPFYSNTGSYAFTLMLNEPETQKNIPVQVREDANGNKQFKFVGWGKSIFTQNGIDLIVDMAPNYSCSVAPQYTGYFHSNYQEYVRICDINTYTGTSDWPSYYDAKTGIFHLNVIYYISEGYFGDYGEETLTMDAGTPPTPSGIPTVADLTTAGYNVTNSRVICIHPDEEVCNPIVWAGTYNNWNTDPSQMLKFEALAGFDGWYVVAVIDNSASVMGKPVQLKLDGSFNWDFQSGDYDAWINMNQPGTQTGSFEPGYFGEADCTWPENGAYIYEVAYFKNHNTPCVAVPKHDYSISLYAPKFCEAIANYADSVRIMGGFDNWTMGKLMEKRVDANNQIYYYTTLPNTEENTEFKFRCGSMSWEFQILYNGYYLANEKTGTETDLVHYYNGKGYNWTFCPEPVYLTVNSNDYSHSITMGSGTYDKDANVLIMAANTDEGYVFDQWNDGNKAAARYVTVSEDVTYTAFFVPKSSETCIEVASNDETLGIAVVAVMALPINGGSFLYWNDGNTNNPRVINELDGTLYTAIFTTGTPTEVQKVEGNDDQAVRKIIKDDRLYIIRNGIEYIATGARTK